MAAADDEVTGFAELMTVLRDRTDRSYADLARCLGMNVSTLYRYCAGDAVPREFAVVERFAALCGASDRERVELHRRWILAGERRRRSRPGVPRGVTASLARSLPDELPVLAAPAAPEVTPGRTGARPSRVLWLRRSVVVCVVLGAVFGLTAAGLSAFSAIPAFSDRSSSGGGALPRHRPSASPTGATVGPSAPAAPFTWTVNSHMWEDDCGHDYIIDKPPGQVPPPPLAEDAEAWANAQDAVHGRETIVQVAVQGRTSSAVVLEALHVRVVRRAAPPAGGVYVYDTSPGCGGGITPRSFEVSLDAHDPVARAMPGSRGDVTVPARRLPYRVSVQDPEVLRVTAKTGSCACEWYLDLDWSSQGRVGTIRIDDRGRPFRTTAITGLPRYGYAGSPRHWMPELP
ncbi:helix-turn-helix domain-containing protein [Streptomyces sp. NPDC001443]